MGAPLLRGVIIPRAGRRTSRERDPSEYAMRVRKLWIVSGQLA